MPPIHGYRGHPPETARKSFTRPLSCVVGAGRCRPIVVSGLAFDRRSGPAVRRVTFGELPATEVALWCIANGFAVESVVPALLDRLDECFDDERDRLAALRRLAAAQSGPGAASPVSTD